MADVTKPRRVHDWRHMTTGILRMLGRGYLPLVLLLLNVASWVA